jgi:hypothetical protein
MRQFPHLMNRKGHYYFRIIVPLSLIPSLDRKELTYSLKTKDYTEGRTRSIGMLNIVQDVFREAHTGKTITEDYLQERLSTFLFTASEKNNLYLLLRYKLLRQGMKGRKLYPRSMKHTCSNVRATVRRLASAL